MIPTFACRRSGRLLVFAASFLLSLSLLPTTARSQSTADETNIEKRLSALEAGQQQIQKSLYRLESKLDQLAAIPSAFSHVVVRVQTSDGKPVPGFEATLHSGSHQTRVAKASGTSDEKGVAIDRYMPYGKYRLSLHEPTGWSVSMADLLVEVGQPLEIDVVAPDPANRGELVLQSDLRAEAFAELPFGEIRDPHGVGYTVGYTPEPDAEGNRARSFPRLGNGISTVGARVKVTVTRTIPQPNGDELEWHWRFASTNGGRTGKLLFTPEAIAIVHVVDSESARPADDSDFFTDLDDNERVGYLTFAEIERFGDSHSIDVPAGSVEVEVIGVLGEATPDVAKSLDIDTQGGQSIWLNVNLQDDSQWTGRIFDEGDWRRATGFSVLSQTISIKPGERQALILASP